jgi:hypothetical protein
MTFRRYSMLSGWGAGAAFAVPIVMWPNMALGMIRAKSAVPRPMEAYQTDSPAIVIPDSARWALGMIGGPSDRSGQGISTGHRELELELSRRLIF